MHQHRDVLTKPSVHAISSPDLFFTAEDQTCVRVVVCGDPHLVPKDALLEVLRDVDSFTSASTLAEAVTEFVSEAGDPAVPQSSDDPDGWRDYVR